MKLHNRKPLFRGKRIDSVNTAEKFYTGIEMP